MWFVSVHQLPARIGPAYQPAPPPLRPKRSKTLRFAMDALVGALLMVAFHSFVIQVSIVRGSSMEPALKDGDRLVVDRVTYSVSDVDRGDVVVLRYPRNPEVDFVKRVVAVPGDRVAMRAGVLFVNGVAADNYGCIPDLESMAEVTVPSRSFFVLGDNRPVSCDSREFGLVEERLIKGRVRARFWPLAAASVF
ncbi:MAG: signal peptidase I [Planctomycetota bacterium]|nr:signal peptidase I [Planctomycetota bacterium]MEC9048190.1 signal peptidase I [Planctomycetota bacterium]